MSSLEPLIALHDFEAQPRPFMARDIDVTVLPIEAACSLRLRAGSDAWPAPLRAAGLDGPDVPGQRRCTQGIEIWRVSRDVMWLFAPAPDVPELVTRIDDALSDVLHQALDQTGALSTMELGGAAAASLLSQGVAISTTPLEPHQGVRTLLGSVPVLLCRVDASRWRLRFDAALGEHLSRWLREAARVAGLSPGPRETVAP